MRRVSRSIAIAIAILLACATGGRADFSEPWKNPERALVVDAYEYNEIDWNALATDRRIAGFINKASDGLPPPYRCSGGETEVKLCKALWKRHAVARELFHTRRTVAKSLGLSWGAYHLGRAGNPIDQANNFIDFARPAADDLIALDIEEIDPGKYISLEDAEEFARHVHRRIGRFPILYTNGVTARFIADNRERYPLLSRLPLWYARYKPEIGEHFPKGNWSAYVLWQFVSQANCSRRSCPYRPPGTNFDIDVNVAPMTIAELRRAWPFARLVDPPEHLLAEVPLPITRDEAIAGKATITWARVERADPATIARVAMRVAGERYPGRTTPPPAAPGSESRSVADVGRRLPRLAPPPQALAGFEGVFGVDGFTTGSIGTD